MINNDNCLGRVFDLLFLCKLFSTIISLFGNAYSIS